MSELGEQIFNELIKIIIQEKDKEIERLNNIINELERHLEQQWLEWKDCETDVRFMANEDKCILEKLRELKGDSSNE